MNDTFRITVQCQGQLEVELESFDDGRTQIHFRRDDQTIWSRDYSSDHAGRSAFCAVTAALGELR